MAENNTAVATQQKSPKAIAVGDFQKVLNNKYYQDLLDKTLKENKGTFVTSLMELFTSDPSIMRCSPNAIISEAIKAASLHLPINKQLGQAYILVFNNKDKKTGNYISTPTLVIGTRGYVNLAIRTNKYETINCGTIYEGELKKQNRITGEVDVNGERISDVPVGYFAYFRMRTGYWKMLYMSIDDVCRFAKKYSPTVKYNNKITWQGLKELAIKQSVDDAGDGLGWYAGFQGMAEKTVLRQLLTKWGELSVEQAAILDADEKPTTITMRDSEYSEAKEVITISTETGDVIEKTEGIPAAEPVDEAPASTKSEPYSLED